MRLVDWFQSAFPSDLPATAIPREVWTEDSKPRPVPLRRRNAPSRDEFAAWRSDPTTAFVFEALSNAAETQRKAWLALSWEKGQADEMALTALRTRADAYKSLEEADYEAFCEWAGYDPEEEINRA